MDRSLASVRKSQIAYPPEPTSPKAGSGVQNQARKGLAVVGIVFALCAAICYGASTVVIGRAIIHAGPLVVAFVSLVAGLVLVGAVTLTVAIITPGEAKVSIEGLPWIVLGSVLMFGVGRLTYYRSIEQIGPSRSAALSSTTTLAVPAVGFLFLGDRLSAFTWLGILVTFVGILTLVTGRSR